MNEMAFSRNRRIELDHDELRSILPDRGPDTIVIAFGNDGPKIEIRGYRYLANQGIKASRLVEIDEGIQRKNPVIAILEFSESGASRRLALDQDSPVTPRRDQIARVAKMLAVSGTKLDAPAMAITYYRQDRFYDAFLARLRIDI